MMEPIQSNGTSSAPSFSASRERQSGPPGAQSGWLRWRRCRTRIAHPSGPDAAPEQTERARPKIIRFFGALLGIATVLFSLLPDARGQSAEERQVLGTIASYMADPGADRMGDLLQEIGFEPAIDDATWRKIPAIHKAEIAWAAAEAAEPSHGGQRLLALMSSRLAKAYPGSFPHEPRFSSTRQVPVAERMAFAPSPKHINPDSRPPLPEKAKKAIIRIAQNTESSAIGTPYDVLTKYMGRPPKQAYDILRRATSVENALEEALRSVKRAAGRHRILQNLVRTLVEEFPAVQVDPDLQPFIEKPAPPPRPKLQNDRPPAVRTPEVPTPRPYPRAGGQCVGPSAILKRLAQPAP